MNSCTETSDVASLRDTRVVLQPHTGPSVKVRIDQVWPESTRHQPETVVTLQADAHGLAVYFEVEDQFVIAQERGFNGPVCLDSCVEMFLQAPGQSSYINFEMNAIGNLHASLIRNPFRTRDGFADFRFLTEGELSSVQVESSITMPVFPEDPEPRSWNLSLNVPWTLLETVFQTAGIDGDWRVNFYKCAEESSGRHWISWSPISRLDFHQPDDFGFLKIHGVNEARSSAIPPQPIPDPCS